MQTFNKCTYIQNLMFLPAGLLAKSVSLEPELSKLKLCSPLIFGNSESSMPAAASRPLRKIVIVKFTVVQVMVKLFNCNKCKPLPNSLSLLLSLSLFGLLFSWGLFLFWFGLVASPSSLFSSWPKLAC